MDNNYDKLYYQIGKFLIGIVFIYKAVEFFACIPSLDAEVPSCFRLPNFWIVLLALIWLAAGISFLFNIGRRFMALIVTAAIVFIIFTSTVRGFEVAHDTSSTLLKITGWFCLMGSALMLGSYDEGKYIDPYTNQEVFTKSPNMFAAGRIFLGAFFMIAGILHLVNVNSDAAYCLP